MSSIAWEYLESIGNIDLEPIQPASEASWTIFSSLTGHEISVDQLRTASYWVQNFVSKVRFADAVADMQSKINSTGSSFKLALIQAYHDL